MVKRVRTHLAKKENLMTRRRADSKKKRNFLKKIIVKGHKLTKRKKLLDLPIIQNILVKNQMKLLKKIIKDNLLKKEKNLKKDKDLKNFHLEDTEGNKI